MIEQIKDGILKLFLNEDDFWPAAKELVYYFGDPVNIDLPITDYFKEQLKSYNLTTFNNEPLLLITHIDVLEQLSKVLGMEVTVAQYTDRAISGLTRFILEFKTETGSRFFAKHYWREDDESALFLGEMVEIYQHSRSVIEKFYAYAKPE